MTLTQTFFVDMFWDIDQCKWKELAAFFSLNGRYERPGYEPLVGRDAIMRFYREERIVGCGVHDLEGCIVSEGLASCWGRFHGVNRGGDALDERFADIYVISDGQIMLRRTHFFRPAI